MEKMIKNFKTQYVGQTQGFRVEKGAYINKKACGCGLTHFLLTNNEDVIVAVPTKALINNKVSQLKGLLAVDGTTSKEVISEYIDGLHGQPIKVVVTFDSIYKVEYLIGDCRLVIDEVQDFFKNYTSKSDVEKARNLYRTTLQICERHKDLVSFVSATPVPVSYFPAWVQELKQVEYNFEYTYKKTPIISCVNSPLKALAGSIITPIIENGSVTIKGKTFRKCLIFINSVHDVAALIRDYDFNPELFGIYCGDTVENDIKLSDMNLKRFTGLNDLPQFAFVTKSGYSGVDFYDSEAMTIVLSTTKKDWQMVDINTDLLQAISRIRNNDNPNKDRYIFIYNQSLYMQEEEELMNSLEDVRNTIADACVGVNNRVNEGLCKLALRNRDFIAYAAKNAEGKYELDEVAFNSQVYQIKEVRAKFLKGFDMSLGEDSIYENLDCSTRSMVPFNALMDKFEKHQEFTSVEKSSKWYSLALEYYTTFGTTTNNSTFAQERLDALKSKDARLEELKVILRNSFKAGSTYAVKDVKEKLQAIYDDLKIIRKAKGTDLSEFADCTIKTVKKDGIAIKSVEIRMWRA